MKIGAIVAAGLSLAAGVAVPAMAQQRAVHERVVERHTVVRGPVPPRSHRVCSVRYHHHHRIRTCRTVRYR